jgi:hypothetical protein
MQPQGDSQNPYQAPTTGTPQGETPAVLAEPVLPTGDLCRDGNILVAAKGAVFPDRCVKCNAPAEGFRLKRALSWHHPALFVLVFIGGLLIYIIAALIVRKSATFYIGVCPEHRRIRTHATIAGWLTFLGGLMLIISAVVLETWTLAIVGLMTMLLGTAYGLMRARLISPKHINKTEARIRGVGEGFLAALPPVYRAR